MTWPTAMKVGIVGTVLTALCCFTPILVVTLGALGIAVGAWLDMILLPALAFFIVLTVIAWMRRGRA